LPVDELAQKLIAFIPGADPAKMKQIAPLVRERIKLLSDVRTIADFFFVDKLAPYDPAELIPQKGDRAMALAVLQRAREILQNTEFCHDALDAALRGEAAALKIKAGQMFQPIRVAVCGRKAAPPLFETLEVIGQKVTLTRIDQAVALLSDQGDYESVKN
jgi:glutamyl-tRNA synthetase